MRLVPKMCLGEFCREKRMPGVSKQRVYLHPSCSSCAEMNLCKHCFDHRVPRFVVAYVVHLRVARMAYLREACTLYTRLRSWCLEGWWVKKGGFGCGIYDAAISPTQGQIEATWGKWSRQNTACKTDNILRLPSVRLSTRGKLSSPHHEGPLPSSSMKKLLAHNGHR